MVSRSPEVHQREVEFVGVLVDAGTAPNDLLKFGHRTDGPIENDQPTGLCVDTSLEQSRGGDNNGIAALGIFEISVLRLAFSIAACDPHEVPVVFIAMSLVAVYELLAHP